MAQYLGGCLLVIVVIALWFGFSALFGLVASWVLAQFGVHVGWFVCAVAIWLLTAVGRGIFGSGK